MASPLAEFLVQLSAGVPIGNGSFVRVPIGEAASMSEKQLGMLAERLQRKPLEDEEARSFDPRAIHREWAKENKIPDWEERRLWAEKEKTLTNGLWMIPAG